MSDDPASPGPRRPAPRLITTAPAVAARRVPSGGQSGRRRVHREDPASAGFRGVRVSVCDARGRPVRAPGLAAWLSGVIGHAARGEVAIALVSDAAMRRLNRDFRGVDQVTDVLSFPAFAPTPRPGVPAGKPSARSRAALADATMRTRSRPQSRLPSPESRGPGPDFLGDIVIARGRAAAQAREARHALGTELRVLALHGLLHLLGYDHESDRGEMARKERHLRRRGGLGAGLIEREEPR